MLTRTLVPVEDIDIAREQEHADTGERILCYDGSGQWNTEKTVRLIVWYDPYDEDQEYPVQRDEWYPRGTLIPLNI